MSSWSEQQARLALLELWANGMLRKRNAQREAWDRLAELSWTRSGRRRGELRLAEGGRSSLAEMLDRAWPDWRMALQALTDAGLAATPEGWSALLDQRRAQELPDALPCRVNRRTAAALTAPAAKAGLTARRREPLAATEITNDQHLRLRVPDGLVLRRGDVDLELDPLMQLLGEAMVTDRAIRNGLGFSGRTPRAVLLVENLGAYIDMRHPPGWLIAHVPGWNLAIIESFLALLPTVPVVHFGDLDPAAVRMHASLRSRCPTLRWLLPAFWAEHFDVRGHPLRWPRDMLSSSLPPLVVEAMRRERWLEQETIALDPRLPGAMETLLRDQ